MGVKVLQTSHGPSRLESDIRRSKMSVKWDTSVGEWVQVLAYDSSWFLLIVESLQSIRSTPVENLFCLARNWLCAKKNILVHKNAQKLTYRHLGFQKFPLTPFITAGRRRGRGCKGKKGGRGGE